MAWASAFEYQLDMLKAEVDTVNTTIRQMDEITKSVKEWTVGLWTAAVGGALATKELMPYVGLTAAIPLLFWLVDTWHRRIQRKFIWRSIAISKFLNGDGLQQSFRDGRLTGIHLMDPKGRLIKGAEYERFVSWYKVMFFRSLALLYLGLTLLSAMLGVGVRLGILKRAT